MTLPSQSESIQVHSGLSENLLTIFFAQILFLHLVPNWRGVPVSANHTLSPADLHMFNLVEPRVQISCLMNSYCYGN
jgi:hypothetical protein